LSILNFIKILLKKLSIFVAIYLTFVLTGCYYALDKSLRAIRDIDKIDDDRILYCYTLSVLCSGKFFYRRGLKYRRAQRDFIVRR